MRITMIGAGYVGLVSGACFAEFGVEVTCVDKDADKVDLLNDHQLPIYEPELNSIVENSIKAGRLTFTTDMVVAAKDADAVFIAVGTPSRRGDGHADLTYVYDVARELASIIDGYTVIVTKSTVPVGTGDEIENIFRTLCPGGNFDVVSNPEFLREGSAINDFMRPDRVIIGTASEKAREVMRELYRPLFLIDTPILFTTRRTAELIKYAANTFLATKITFINEIADLCEQLDADIQDVSKGIGLDGRIGNKFLHAGPGYGGSCFPKDTLALVRTAQDANSPLKIVEAVVEINEKRKHKMIEKILEACEGSFKDKKVGVLGLTFKPNTDDMRDAPSLIIVPALLKGGANVLVYDPQGMEEAKGMLEGVQWCNETYEAAEGTDVVVILTEWNEFRALDLKRLKDLMRRPVMVDLRNIYNPAEMLAGGFDYYCVGRKNPTRNNLKS